jgi:histidyl-tRNA synthetase
MKKVIPPVKGTRDFYPEQMAVRAWLYNTARSVAESFGYQEYEAPILESLALYIARSATSWSDQAYVFADRGGDQIAPAGLTASLARMIAQRQADLAFPCAGGRCPSGATNGRSGADANFPVERRPVGASSPEADAENVAVWLVSAACRSDPAQVLILVNDRRLMDSSFDGLAIEVSATTLSLAPAKIADAAWRRALELGLSAAQLADLEALLRDQDLWRRSPELRRFFAAIEALGLHDMVRFDASIVRGLQYYTGTVFEAWEVGGDIRRSLLGGGRYDNLLSDVGGSPLPAVGFALGDVVMTLLLEKYQLLRRTSGFPRPDSRNRFDAAHQLAALQLAPSSAGRTARRCIPIQQARPPVQVC